MTTTTTYPSDSEIYTACAWMADDLKIEMWEDQDDAGRRVFILEGNGPRRELSPAHCYDELQAMKTKDTSDHAHDARHTLAEDNAIGTELMAPCRECDGSALDMAGQPCAECSHGQQPATVVECAKCRGNGWNGIGDDSDCSECWGSGKVLEYTKLTMWAVTVDERHGTTTHLVYEELGQLDELLAGIDHKSMTMEQVTI